MYGCMWWVLVVVGKIGRRQSPDGEVRERGGRVELSDICSVQGVKRVICHLIENLCAAQTEIRKHTFLSILMLTLCCYLCPQVTSLISNSPSVVPIHPPASVSLCRSVTRHIFSCDALSHNSVFRILSKL